MRLYGKYKLLRSEMRLLSFIKAPADRSDRTTAELQIVILFTIASCFSVMEKGGVAVKFCACFEKVLVIFPHFFHANAETVPKPRLNNFLPNFFILSFISRPTSKLQEIVSDPVLSINPFLET
jgi:hypothetical protein